MKNYDILSIGDITTDAFIRLKDAEVHCGIDNKNCELCVKFGSKIPYESVEEFRAVGNSANASVSASRLGLSSALMSWIGDDRGGKECLAELEKNNVGTEYIKIEEGKQTNYHFVLWYEVDRTILIKHENFSYELGEFSAPKWIYLSSMSDSSFTFQNQLADYLNRNPEVKLAFQPGTFQIKAGVEHFKKIYERADIFFCNLDEARTITGIESDEPKILLEAIARLGPKSIVITDNLNGAYAWNGEKYYFVPDFPGEAFERTGAGDAFASAVVSALALGRPFGEAMLWGPVNSASVIKYVGAQKGLLTRDQLEKYLSEAPEGYKLKEI